MSDQKTRQAEEDLMEVTEEEYLEEMERMLPIVKGNPRLAKLLLYVKQVNDDFDMERPEQLVAQFVDDMDVLAGKK